jgi:hypothetical protein
MSTRNSPAAIHARWLEASDVVTLLELEQRHWQTHQAASAQTLLQRIRLNPHLSIGAFCSDTGAALCSLFMKPMTEGEVAALHQGTAWSVCAAGAARPSREIRRSRSLFGISLTSADNRAVRQVMAFFYPHALRAGWHRIYLGSPMPGLAEAVRRQPSLTAAEYAPLRRGQQPLDPQLRYYHRHGFKTLLAVQPGYFPHAESLDHGAILMGHVPLARLHPLWRSLPAACVQPVSRMLFKLL